MRNASSGHRQLCTVTNSATSSAFAIPIPSDSHPLRCGLQTVTPIPIRLPLRSRHRIPTLTRHRPRPSNRLRRLPPLQPHRPDNIAITDHSHATVDRQIDFQSPFPRAGSRAGGVVELLGRCEQDRAEAGGVGEGGWGRWDEVVRALDAVRGVDCQFEWRW